MEEIQVESLTPREVVQLIDDLYGEADETVTAAAVILFEQRFLESVAFRVAGPTINDALWQAVSAHDSAAALVLSLIPLDLHGLARSRMRAAGCGDAAPPPVPPPALSPACAAPPHHATDCTALPLTLAQVTEAQATE